MSHQPNSIAVIGVGLMGGSIGLGTLTRKICAEVIGVGRDMERLEVAQSLGAITSATTDIAEAAKNTDLVIICTPSGQVVDVARQVFEAAGDQVIITDVASTKREIVESLQPQIAAGMKFVGSHPLCGSHKTGVEAADANLFRHKKIVVTPAANRPLATDAKSIVREVVFFWKSLSGVPIEMSCEDHDQALAATSHLPHMIAAILASSTPPELLSLVGSGWRDMTRVAAGSVEIWHDILQQNRESIISSTEHFNKALTEFKDALEREDWDTVIGLLEQGKKQRDAVGN